MAVDMETKVRNLQKEFDVRLWVVRGTVSAALRKSMRSDSSDE